MRDRAPALLRRLRAMLAGPYSFTAYGAGRKDHSINFGLVTTFRQQWVPVTYQAGDLLRTVPLAPGEVRKYSRRTVVRHKRAVAELQRASELRRNEFATTTRADSEIVRAAMTKTNFGMTTEGTYTFGVFGGKSAAQVGRDVAQDSRETKRDFREAVAKAAQEFKQERSVEISTEDSAEFEETEAAEIKNPNDELAVTYLFYELQRRFRVSEQIHRVTPVVLVAQQVPNPSEITDAWLLAHDWVLRRVILDEQFLPALRYLASRVAGDEESLDQLRTTVETHRSNAAELRRELVQLERLASLRFESVLEAIRNRADEIEEEDTDGWFADFGESLGFGEGESVEAERLREEATRKAEERAVERVKQTTMELQREVTALDAATERYGKALADHRNRQVQIDRLRLHVKDNIIYYMQGVWAHEAEDQRYLRLRETPVPRFAQRDGGTRYRFTGEQLGTRFEGVRDGAAVESVGHAVEVDPDLDVAFGEQTLAEVADLDTLLGFHGNYLIFPLREPNPLTEFLLAPYVGSGFALIDPDEPGPLTRDEFARYVCHLHDTLTEEEFASVKPALKERYARLLTDPTPNGEEIIVPTGSVFIEMLPSSHTLLEDFKLAHRAVDVKRAQAEVREAELDNVRRGARIGAGDLADPDIESISRVAVHGDGVQPVIDVGDE